MPRFFPPRPYSDASSGFHAVSGRGVVDKVVAMVDGQIITLFELNSRVNSFLSKTEGISTRRMIRNTPNCNVYS